MDKYFSYFCISLLLSGWLTSASAADDVMQQKAAAYSMSILFKPLVEKCDTRLKDSQKRYTKAFQQWQLESRGLLLDAEQIAFAMLRQTQQEPISFYQQQKNGVTA